MSNKVNLDKLIEDKYKAKTPVKSGLEVISQEIDRLLETYPGYQYHSNYNYIMDEEEQQGADIAYHAGMTGDPRNPISPESNDETQPTVGAGLANKPAFSGVGMFEEQEIDEVAHKTIPELTQLNKELEALQSTGNLPEFVIVPVSGYRLKVVTDTDVNRKALVASPEIQSLLNSHSMNKGTGHTHIYSKSIGKTKTGKDVKATILFKTKESTARTGSRKEEELAVALADSVFKITGLQQDQIATAGSSNGIDVPLMVNNKKFNIEVKTQGGADFGQFTVIYDINAGKYTINQNSTTYKRARVADPELKMIIDRLWGRYRSQFAKKVKMPDMKKYAAQNKITALQKIPTLASKEELKNIMLGGSEAAFVQVDKADITQIAKYYATKNDFIVVDTYLYKLKNIVGYFNDIPSFEDSITSCSIRLRFKAHRTDGPWDITASFKIVLDKTKTYSINADVDNNKTQEFIKELLRYSQSAQPAQAAPQELKETKSFNKIKVMLR
jgi:hypothetical protein